MTLTETLVKVGRQLIEDASTFLKDGPVMPVLATFTADGTSGLFGFASFPDTSDARGELLAQTIKRAEQEFDAPVVAALFLSDGWVKDPETGARTGEALILNPLLRYGAPPKMLFRRYHREDGTIRFEEIVEVDGVMLYDVFPHEDGRVH